MENRDVFRVLTSRLDNSTLEYLSLIPEYWTEIRKLSSDQNFWYLRTQNLMKRELEPRRNVDWKEAYRVLLPVVTAGGDMFTKEVVQNLLAVEVLLESGVDPSLYDNSAIVEASNEGSTEVVRFLLSDPRVDPSAQDSITIGLASLEGHIEVVRLLLADGRADPRAQDNIALRQAVGHGHLEVVKLLLADPRVDPTADSNYTIGVSSNNGDAAMVKLLLEDGRVDPAANNNNALRSAVIVQAVEVVKLLLADPRVDPAAGNSHTIRVASSNGSTEIVKLLLEDGRADPAAENSHTIRVASSNGYTEIVKLLLEDGRADPTLTYNYAIAQAVKKQHLEVVKLLIADGRADPTVDINGLLPYAVRRGNADMVEALLSDDRFSPHAISRVLQLVSNTHPEVAEVLLADPRIDPTYDNNAALYVAAREGRTEIVKLLLAYGREHNTDPEVNDELVHRAILQGLTGLEIIRIVLEDPRTNISHNTIRTAIKSGNTEALRLILAHNSVQFDDGGQEITDIAVGTGIPESISEVVASDKVDLQSIEASTMSDVLDTVSAPDYIIEDTYLTQGTVSRPIYLGRLISNNFEDDHYFILLRELILKKGQDLKYFFQWLVGQCDRHADALEYRRVIAEAAESFYDTGVVRHTSSLFTAYSGFLLLAKIDNRTGTAGSKTGLILNTLSEEQGVTEEGLQLASMLIRAYLR